MHRDLKPANILVDGTTLKLADFGIGGIVAGYAVGHSQIGRSMINQLHADEQMSLLHGSGTPLYMDPEQRKGGAPNAKHDLHSLGIIWYQLLVGDVTREFHGGWDDELAAKFNVPKTHIDVIKQCVGWINRPANGGELLKLLQGLSPPGPTPPPKPEIDEFDDLSPEGATNGGDSKHPKYAYLVDGSPKEKTVYLLVKVHDWDAKAVYVYDLITGNGPEHISGSKKPEQVTQWKRRAERDGHQIPHKGGISVEKAQAWVQYATAEAAKRGLTIAK